MNKGYKQIVINEKALKILDKIRDKMPQRGTVKASYSQVVLEIERKFKK